MFSIMDFLPTLGHHRRRQDADDRPIDGVDQTDVLFGKAMRHRESLLSFIGPNWWRRDGSNGASTLPTCTRPASDRSVSPACSPPTAPMAGYPKIYNIEMDPHEDLIFGAMFGWVSGPALKTVDEYLATVKKYPRNPPAPNITQFRSGG